VLLERDGEVLPLAANGAWHLGPLEAAQLVDELVEEVRIRRGPCGVAKAELLCTGDDGHGVVIVRSTLGLRPVSDALVSPGVGHLGSLRCRTLWFSQVSDTVKRSAMS
jgi:hypothetical protein